MAGYRYVPPPDFSAGVPNYLQLFKPQALDVSPLTQFVEQMTAQEKEQFRRQQLEKEATESKRRWDAGHGLDINKDQRAAAEAARAAEEHPLSLQSKRAQIAQTQASTGQVGKTATINEYEFARKNGFQGSFDDWKKNAGADYGKAGTIFERTEPDGSKRFYGVQFGSNGQQLVREVTADGRPLAPAKGVKQMGDELISNATGDTVRNVAPQIAGGEAAKEIGEAKGKAIAAAPKLDMAQESLEAKNALVFDEIKLARDLAQNVGGTTGMVASLARAIPGTPAYALAQRIKTIKANVGFNELNQMRQESPTGGALGQVAVQEIEFLQSALGSLDQPQPAADIIRTLDQIERYMQGSAARRRRALEIDRRRFGTAEDVPGAPGASVNSNKDQRRLAPPVGQVEGGYRFKGGDPSRRENWEPVR